MTTTNIKLPCLGHTGLDGKKLYTPNEWTERFRHHTKRIYNVDIKQILTEDTVPTRDPKRTRNQTRLHLGRSTVSDRNNHQRRIQHGPRHYQNRQTNTSISGILHAQKKHLPQPWRFLLVKTRRQRNTRRTLEEADNPRKNCDFEDIKQEDLLISKVIIGITDKTFQEKHIRKKQYIRTLP